MSDTKEMDQIIVDLWEKGTLTEKIAVILNVRGYKTITGKGWKEGSVSAYARRNLGLQNRYNRPVGIKKNVKETFHTEPSPIIIEEVKEEADEPKKTEPNFNPSAIAVYEKGGKFWTDSRAVAEVFGKRHDAVLRAIRNLDCTKEFREQNFIYVFYKDSQNKEQPMVEITKDGAKLLVLGFTGSNIVKIKELFIEKFNEIEEAKTETQEPNFNAQAITVYEKGGKFWTDSKAVAEVFGKEHKHVLRDIKELIASNNDKEFNESNFGLVIYLDKKGEQRPMFQLTRDGFAILAMGFTGSKALEFKLAYMKRFNEMEEALRKQQAPKAFSAIDLLKMTLQGFEEVDQKLNEATKKLDEKINESIADYNQKLNETISKVDEKVKEVLTGIDENQKAFFDPPAPSVILPFYDKERSNCHSLVNTICDILKIKDRRIGCSKIYNMAYKVYNPMFQVNIGLEAEKQGINKIEAVALAGNIGALYAIIYEIYTQALENNTNLLNKLNVA